MDPPRIYFIKPLFVSERCADIQDGVLSGPPVSTDSLSALGASDASEASEDGDATADTTKNLRPANACVVCFVLFCFDIFLDGTLCALLTEKPRKLNSSE